MSNQLNGAEVITPPSNVVTAVLTGWESKGYNVPGTPNGAEEVNFLLEWAWGAATAFEVFPEHASPDAPTDFYPLGRIDATGDVFNDAFTIEAINLEPAQVRIDLNLKVKGGEWVRLRARAVGPSGATTLDAKVTAGGGGVHA